MRSRQDLYPNLRPLRRRRAAAANRPSQRRCIAADCNAADCYYAAMLKRRILDGTTTPDGQELQLSQRGDDFFIDIDRWELMSSLAHGSEDALVHLAKGALKGCPQPNWLIGGLGMGFTLRACVDAVKAAGGGSILVAEVFQAVVDWNRGPLAHLASSPLDDASVTIKLSDIYDQLDPQGGPFDIILLDVDNGPDALTLVSNQRLYRPEGLAKLRRTLSPKGVLAIWSAGDDEGFRRRLRKARFDVRCKRVTSRPNRSGLRHTIFLAQPR